MKFDQIKIDMSDIDQLCTSFGVNFSVEVSEDRMLLYKFGPVSWCVQLGDNFSLYDYMHVGFRLAANFPDKVLKEFIF